MPNSLKCRLKGLVRKGLLSEKDLSRIYTDNDVVEELEKIKADLIENPIWVQYIIKGHEENDIQELVTDVLVQGKNEVIRRLDKELSELKGEQE